MERKDKNGCQWVIAAASLTKPPGWFAGWAKGNGPEGMVTRWVSHQAAAVVFDSRDEAAVEANLVGASWPSRAIVVVPLGAQAVAP